MRFNSLWHFEQYCGALAILPAALERMLDQVKALDMAAHVAQAQGQAELGGPAPVAIEDGVAIIEITGTLTKYGSSLSDSPSMIDLRRIVRTAAEDPKIRAIMLRIDSPGGTVAGCADLAAEVEAAAKRKPVTSYAEDLCASASYWVAAGASRLVCNSTATVGSVGVYAVLRDLSKAADLEGVKVLVIRSGQFKGAGTPGTEITPEQIGAFQREVDAINALFLAAVSRGRGLKGKGLQAIADGAAYIGQGAVEMGLVDAVETWEEAMANLRGRISKTSTAIGAGGGGKSLAGLIAAWNTPSTHSLMAPPPAGKGMRLAAASSPPAASAVLTRKEDFTRASIMRNTRVNPLALRKEDIDQALRLSMMPAEALVLRNEKTPATETELREAFEANGITAEPETIARHVGKSSHRGAVAAEQQALRDSQDYERNRLSRKVLWRR